MKTQPITPAGLLAGDMAGATAGAAPVSSAFEDPCAPGLDTVAQARHVFLQGNGLPARWAGRRAFTVLQTGFGVGNGFLATWDAWRCDPARCERLFFVSIEHHPPRREDLVRAHAASPWPDLAARLVQTWPPLVPNLHPLDFEGGRVQLLLALGDLRQMLPALRLSADAFYLDGLAPARSPAMAQIRLLRTLGRRAAPGATAAGANLTGDMQAGLKSAGFEVRHAEVTPGQPAMTVARHAPTFVPRGPAADAPAPFETAVVVGAGLAGAAVAQALARLGLDVTVVDRRCEPASETSGNPAGLFHGTVYADDGPYARLFRAAALVAQREYGAAVERGVAGSAAGLLRLQTRADGQAAMQAVLDRLGLPADYVQALGQGAATQRARVPLATAAWFYPGGGWIAPPAWVRHALATPGIRFRGGVQVAVIERHGCDWLLRDAAGQALVRAPLVVLAQAADTARLLAPLGGPAWPLHHSRGQVTQLDATALRALQVLRPPLALRLPLAGDGYALPLPDGGLLCGATQQEGEAHGDESPREQDHRYNLQRLQRLTGIPWPVDPASCRGRVGWRLHADDRLPIAGAVPLPVAAGSPGQRLDQARLLPRHAGLFVLTALGSRGLTLAPLLGRLVAAQATGTPWPLEQDLADAVDPGRWIVRAARAFKPAEAGPRGADSLQPG